MNGRRCSLTSGEGEAGGNYRGWQGKTVGRGRGKLSTGGNSLQGEAGKTVYRGRQGKQSTGGGRGNNL